jgi:hypothetical protein
VLGEVLTTLTIDPEPERGSRCNITVRGPDGELQRIEAEVGFGGQVTFPLSVGEEGPYHIEAAVRMRGIIYTVAAQAHLVPEGGDFFI